MTPTHDRLHRRSRIARAEQEGAVDDTRTAAQLLIVEDNVIIAFDLQSILTRLGYDVVGMVPSGEQALQKVREMAPDVVLMDINLEGELDGIETAALIQAQFDIPVIFLTGYSEDVLPQESELSGPHAYLSKPVHEGELCDTIEMMLSMRGTSQKGHGMPQGALPLPSPTGRPPGQGL